MPAVILISKTVRLADEHIHSFIEKEGLSPLEVHRIQPATKEFSITQIRELKADLTIQQKTPHLYVLESFDRASLEAQNALLKTLEEQTTHHIVMIVSNEDALLPTVRSRSTILALHEPKETQSSESELLFQTLQDCLTKHIYAPLLALPLLQGVNDEKARIILTDMILFFRNRLSDDRNAAKTVRKLFAQLSLLTYNNLNPQLAVDTVLIFIAKTYKLKLK